MYTVLVKWQGLQCFVKMSKNSSQYHPITCKNHCPSVPKRSVEFLRNAVWQVWMAIFLQPPGPRHDER